MTYEEALAFWYGRVNYEQRTPQPADLKLDRMRALLHLLGDPQERLRIVHVAGSKGKGSSSAMLAQVLRQAGYRTGLFTSPHLNRVEERIQVDGVPITAEELAILMADVRQAVAVVDRGDPRCPVTFFEIVTALGFLHFVRRRVEVAVIEVGLGGRFDSTNVCRPLVSLITSISFDHTQQLGTCLASIAGEKAGIVKPGRPAVSGALDPEAQGVIARFCRERRAPLRQLGREFHFTYQPGRVTQDQSSRPVVQVSTARRDWPSLELGLLGEHQAANAAVVIACIEELKALGLHVPDQAVVEGLGSVNWPARLEVVGRRPLVILDCAHNVASIQALVETLQTSFPPGRRSLIFAVSNDKDLSGICQVLAPHFQRVYLTRYASSPRSAAPESLAVLFRHANGLRASVHPTAAEAWRAAYGEANSNDLLCVTGSVFLAGELGLLLRCR